MIIALAGNQNCGKTTLFNRLTGARQHVGNWPGVTVEKKSGILLERWLPGAAYEMIDLPGVYSLSPFSQEEEITRHFLTQNPPDVILNVVDATHLERHLYLTLQLLQLGRPVVIALNLMDELRKQGGSIKPLLLSEKLGVPVLPICARSGEGLSALMHQVKKAAMERMLPPDHPRCGGEAEATLQRIARFVRSSDSLQQCLQKAGLPVFPYAASAALVEGGMELVQGLSIGGDEKLQMEESLRMLEKQSGMTAASALATGRYRYLEQVTAACCSRGSGAQYTIGLDRWLLRSGWAIPIWLAVMLLMFSIAFGRPGQWLTEVFTGWLQWAAGIIANLLVKGPVTEGLQSLLLDGLLPGLSSVLSFLPPLMLLMFFLHLLEESGYLARLTVLMDPPLRSLGLSGRSLIPFLLGFGCTVPAVLSARGMKNRRERNVTILLTPLMSCGAKLPVYLLMIHAFFPSHQTLLMPALYLLGILTAVMAGRLVQRFRWVGLEEPFLMELPAYRWPSLSNALRELWQRGSEFLKRTFSVILLATLAVWVLSRHTFALKPAADLPSSMLGRLSGWLSPLLRPCGFGHEAAAAALLTGLLAKENIVSTLAVLTGVEMLSATAASGLQAVFPDSLSAFSFLVFVLLYPPCAAATATLRRELGSTRHMAAIYAGYLMLAWLVSTLIYQVGGLLY